METFIRLLHSSLIFEVQSLLNPSTPKNVEQDIIRLLGCKLNHFMTTFDDKEADVEVFKEHLISVFNDSVIDLINQHFDPVYKGFGSYCIINYIKGFVNGYYGRREWYKCI